MFGAITECNFLWKELFMSTTKKWLMIAMSLACVGVFLCANGCSKSGEAEKTDEESIQLCTMCGQIKGDELCCKPDQSKCPKCGLVKGSPGCCKIPKGAQAAALCTMCGQIKGSDLCCKQDQPKCSKCGLVKGSPGCCKIPKL